MNRLDDGKYQLDKMALREFLIHGLKYVFPVELGEPTRGAPTARVVSGECEASDLQIVWPDPDGRASGFALEPLYPSVLEAIKKDNKLYRLLTLTDMIRYRACKETKLAEKLLVAEL